MSVGAKPDGAGRIAVGWACGTDLAGVGLGIGLGWSYGSDLTNNGPYGYGGNVSVNEVLTAEAATPPTWVTIQRSAGNAVSFAYDSGTKTYGAETANVLSGLTTFSAGGSDYWKEERPDGSVEVYPYRTNGQLCSLSYAQDAVGNRLTYSYDTGRPSSIQEPAGRRVTFSYDGNNLLQTVQDWAQRLTTLQYDTASVGGKPLLTTITGPSGCQTAYGYTTAYTGNPQLNSITDPNGYQTTYVYYADGRCQERTVVGVGTTRYTYTNFPPSQGVTDALGNLTTTSYYVTLDPYTRVGPDGVVTTYARNEAGLANTVSHPTGAITTTTRTSYLYDPANSIYHPFLPLTVTDPLGHTTSYAYDGLGNQTQVTQPDGTTVTTVWAYGGSSFDTTGAKRRPQVMIDPLGLRTTLSYNALGYVTAITEPTGAITSFGYDAFANQVTVTDALGRVTTRTFDAAGRVTTAQNALGYVTTISYDPLGRPLETTDPLGYITTRAYDSGGRLTVMIDPLGYRTSYAYNAFDAPVTVQDALGNVSTSSYDVLGRPVASIDPLGHTSTTAYDSSGRRSSTEDALGNFATFGYDAYSRPVSVTDPLGHIATRVYDIADRPIASISPSGAITTSNFDSYGRPVGNTNALGYLNTIVYDAYGRRAASVDPLGYRVTAVYDAYSRTTGAVDPLGNRTTAVYDVLDRVQAQQDARGYFTTFTFDAVGQRTAITDANGHAWSNTYDARGGLTVETDPLGARTSYSYDGRGSVTQRLDARGWPTTYTFDALGRTDHLVYVDGTRATNTYDAAGRQTVMGDVSGLTTYAYDAANRLTQVAQPAARPLTYAYDAAGNRTSLLDYAAGRTTYTYDMANRPAAILNPYNERTTWTWDLLGRQQTHVLGNGVTASLIYDAASRPTALGWRKSDGTPVGLYTATYDAVGNRTGVSELAGSFAYGYDASRQLLTEQRTGSNAYYYTYTYDGPGNRLTLNADGSLTTSTYNAADELTLTQAAAGLTTYTYDANGNTLTQVAPGGATTYTWNGESRMTEVVDGDGTETYTYAATGLRRRKKVTGGGTTYFVWDGVNVLSELDADLATVAQYTDWPGQWGGLSSARRSGSSQFLGFDLSSNTRMVLDGSASTTDSYLYSAFGPEVAVSGASANPMRFGGEVGYYRDLAARLYVRARHLATQQGRFLSRDPVPIGGALHRQSYVSNDPVAASDPSGLVSAEQLAACIDLCIRALAPGLKEEIHRLLTDIGQLLADMDRLLDAYSKHCSGSYSMTCGPWSRLDCSRLERAIYDVKRDLAALSGRLRDDEALLTKLREYCRPGCQELLTPSPSPPLRPSPPLPILV